MDKIVINDFLIEVLNKQYTKVGQKVDAVSIDEVSIFTFGSLSDLIASGDFL